MKPGDDTPQTARTKHAFINARVNAAFVHAGKKAAEERAYFANGADESIPDETIEPARKERGCFAQRDDGVGVKLVDPHLVFEEAEQSGLGSLERVGLAGATINQNPEADSARHERQGDKQHGLNKQAEVERGWFA